MDNQQPQDAQQPDNQTQQDQDHGLLRQERKARGDLRDDHLQAARDQAKAENTLAQERNEAKPLLEDLEGD
jgi:hypothetical protein